MGDPHRIVSFNVRYFGHALRGLASTRAVERLIATGLETLDPLPSIVCLQEVETRSVRSTWARAAGSVDTTQLESFMGELEAAFARSGRVCPYEAFYFKAHAYAFRNVNVYTTGLAILVDVTRVRVDAHNVEAPEHITHHHILRVKDRKQTRICAHMRVADELGRPLHVFNTHLSLPTPFTREFWTQREKMGHGPNQLHEARKLVSFVQQQARGEPFVVCGDFNSPPGSPVYRHLVDDGGFVAALAALGICSPNDPRAFPTAGFMHLRMHLDHLFAGNDLAWTGVDGTCRFGDRDSRFAGLSDHAPLLGTFRVDTPAMPAPPM